MIKYFLILTVFLATTCSAYSQKGQVAKNFATYYKEYRDVFIENIAEETAYGLQFTLQMQFLDARFLPFPDLPNEKIKDQQDALCGTLKVKQKKFTLSNGREYVTDYDEQGRVIKYTTQNFVQTFRYYADSIIENVSYGYSELKQHIKCKYDSKKRLQLLVKLPNTGESGSGDILCGRQYTADYFRSVERVKNTYSEKFDEAVYNISYMDGSAEDPDQTVGSIYDLQGKVIESGRCKFNYYENGLLKSFIASDGPGGGSGNYTYDEKGRLTAYANSYYYGKDASFSYLDNGLLNKVRGKKVKYVFY
ncbi:MAG: hypothetical protein Q7W13_18950 [Bacteroidia bacterium]|nr:hypothetical protein [Bacteroidia bacterium]